MDHFDRGKKALAESNYTAAIEEFTAALKASPTSPPYLIQRSTAYQRSKDHAAALTDANNAVLNAQKRAKRELIVEAQFRRGVALYGLERYGDAQFVFEVVKRMNEKHNAVGMWLQKTKMATQKLNEGDEKLKCTAKETPEAEESGKEEGKASPNGTANGAASAPQQQASSGAPTQPQQTPPDKIRHEWYQSNDNVYFTLLAKGVPKDKAQIDIQERSLNISFPLTTGSSYDFTLDPLFAHVKPEKCFPRVLPTKIEVILAKATSGQRWSALEGKSESSSVPPASTTSDSQDGTDEAIKSAVSTDSKPSGPVYPTSSKSGPKDWDKIAKGESKSSKDDGESSKDGLDADDDDDEGGDPANAFFKKLFKGSSPEVQKAMMKSYTESNGTALSTNWEEVSKGKVETVPPDGMEARKW